MKSLGQEKSSGILILLFCVILVSVFVSPVSAGWNNVTGTVGTVRLTGSSATWADFQAASVGNDEEAWAMAVIQTGSSKYQQIARGYFVFNTTSLNYTPANAYLKFTLQTCWNTNGDSYVITTFTPDSIADPDFDDYNNFGTSTYTEFPYANRSDLISVPYSAITPGGTTVFGIRTQDDISNTAPGVSVATEYDGLQISGVTLCMSTEEAVQININATPAGGIVPLEVAFQDDSTGAAGGTYILSYGDGSYSSGSWSQYQYYWHTYHSEGSYNVSYNVTVGGTSYYDSVSISVTNASAGGNNYYVQVSGLNTSVIEGATVEISYDGSVQDSEDTNSAGRAYFGVSPGRTVTGTVNKAGYQEATFSQYIPTWSVWTPVTLYATNETPGTGDSYANLILTIANKQTGEPITNTPVFVKIYSDGSYSELFESGTTYTGTYNALLPVNTTYYFKLTAAVYADTYFSTSISETTFLTKYMNPINPGSDIDGDGIPDMWDDDVDGDGIDNDSDTDDDGDGTPDTDDDTPGGGTQQVLQPTIHIWAYSTTGIPISGALVTVTSDIDSGSTVTTPNGTAYYFCADLIQGQSRVYNVTVHHGAYTDQSAFVTVTTSNPSITYYMTPASGVVTPTPTSVYVPPTLPVWSGDNGTPGNLQEFVFNYTIGTLGISFTASGMLLGLIICIVCAAIVGGASNSGMGAMIGGGFGWLAAGVMGYIPAWAIIVSVALVVMAFFIMRGSGNED